MAPSSRGGGAERRCRGRHTRGLELGEELHADGIEGRLQLRRHRLAGSGILALRIRRPPVHQELVVQMRTRRESRRADVPDRLLLPDALPDMHAGGESRQMPVARANAVGVADFDQIAIPAIASRFGDDPVRRGAHGSPVRRRVVGSLVCSPTPENGMEAPAESARDMAEAERRAQERAAQRTAAVVVEAASTARAIEREGEAGRAGHVDPSGENAAEPLLAVGRLEPLDQDFDAISRPQIAREVDFPVIDVGNRPRERDPLADRKEGIGDRRVEGVVQIRLNDGGGAEPFRRPGDFFDRLAPAGVPREPVHHQMRFGGEPHAEATGDGGALHAAQLEDQSRLHAPGIECLRGFHECDVLAAGDPTPCQHVGKHLTASESIGPLVVGTRHHDR